MSQLLDTLKAVKDEHLTKTQLLDYQTKLTSLHTEMQLELADIEKAEAIFFHDFEVNDPEMPDVKVKRIWRSMEQGQRQILLNRYLKLLAREFSSLKSRLYEMI